MVSCAPVVYRRCAAIGKRLQSGYQPAAGWQPAPLLLFVAVALTAQTNFMQSKLIIIDPRHFHATLLQKDMYP